jgi:DNA helicase II / ATP-dependent DNA helicase PcrA
VFVDEVQDYTPFQLEYLKRLFPRCKMTVLGDLNQAIYAHASVLKHYDPVLQLYGPDQTEIIQLKRSYRSTKQIVKFTRGMIAGGEEIIPFERNGDLPLVTIVSDREQLHDRIASSIETLGKEGYESIAVICKTKGESEDAYESLKQLVSVSLIGKSTPVYEKGVVVIPAYLAKGVEFDAVLIYNASNLQYSHEDERNLFYTACTRAMHHLHVYSLGQPCQFITSVDSNTFRYKS